MIEKPNYSFDYSINQWSAIEAALKEFSLSPGELNGLKLKLIIRINALYYGDSDGRKVRNAIRQDLSKAQAAIQSLFQAVGDRVGNFGEMEGIVIEDEIGTALEKASPHLKEMEWLIQRRQIDADLGDPRKDLPPTSNNERGFIRRLMDEVSDNWSRYGGVINHGKGFEVFFVSVVKPVLEHPTIRQSYNCAWSDGMFRNYVQLAMKARGLSGSRGPKRKLRAEKPTKIQN